MKKLFEDIKDLAIPGLMAMVGIVAMLAVVLVWPAAIVISVWLIVRHLK